VEYERLKKGKEIEVRNGIYIYIYIYIRGRGVQASQKLLLLLLVPRKDGVWKGERRENQIQRFDCTRKMRTNLKK
jgi:hypothetical protein